MLQNVYAKKRFGNKLTQKIGARVTYHTDLFYQRSLITVNYCIGYVNEDFTMSFRKSSYIFRLNIHFKTQKSIKLSGK